MRLYACVEDPRRRPGALGRLHFSTRPAALIDLIAVAPFFLEALFSHLIDLRFLRVFRLVRLMKLTRYSGATQTLLTAMNRERPVIAAAGFIMMLLVVVAASLGYLFEHEAQPDKFENIPQAIYWSVITLASVGYGDIAPITPGGRLVTVVLALLGIGIFAIPAAILTAAFNEQLRLERELLQNELYKMLEDDHISAAEQQLIDREAARLRLSKSDLERLMLRAQRDRQVEAGRSAGAMPYALIQQRPGVAFEQYRILVSQLQQIAELADHQALADRLRAGASPLEKEIWGLLSASAMPLAPGAREP
jgi:voltage-gated potassium channel